MQERAVTMVQQKLYNEIADTLDFQAEKYDQGVWGNNVDYWIDSDGEKWQGSEHQTLTPMTEHLSCNTQACVAGWACLLSGYHPTIMVNDIDKSYHFQWLPMNINSYITYNYDVMCNIPHIATPKIMASYSTSDRYLTMEDIDEDVGVISKKNLKYLYPNVEVIGVDDYPDGVEFIRPDSYAADLLNLDYDESQSLFSGDHWWTGDNIRSVGKGEDIEGLAYYYEDDEDD